MTMAPKNNRKSGHFNPFLLIRLFGVILFIYILSLIDLHELWENIRNIKTEFLLYGLAFQFILLIVKGFRWHILNNGSKYSQDIVRSMGEFLESYAIGVITPGRLGELMKAGHAKEKNRVMETGIRIIIESGIDVGVFVIVAGTASVIAYAHLIPASVSYLILIAGIVIFFFSIFLMRSSALTRLAQKLLNNIPFLKHSFQLNFRPIKSGIMISIVLLSIISNLSAFLSCYMLAIGLNFDLSFLFVSGGIAIAGLLNMLPITVMGLGTREGTFLLLFKPMAEPLILAFSGLVFLVAQVGGGLMSLILGQLLLLSVREKKRSD